MMAGYAAARGELRFSAWPDPLLQFHWLPIDLIHAGLYLAFAMGAGSVLNQIHDIESDTLNSKLFILGKKYVPVQHAYIESILLLIFSIVLAYLLNPASALVLILSLVWAGYLYNFYPFAFKNYPIRGLIANMGMGWSVFVMGWLVIKPFDIDGIIVSIPYLLYNTALYLITTLPDMLGDKRTGKRTIAVAYGPRATLWLCLLFMAMSLVTAFYLQDALVTVVAVAAIPLVAFAAFRQNVETAVRAVKLGIFLFSLGICIKFPGFLVMIVAAYFGTRYYYKARFDYDYPNFKGK